MTAFVLDASIAVAATLQDETNLAVALHLMGEAERLGAAVPALWPTELGNALLVASRRGRISDDQLRDALRRLLALNLRIEPADPVILWEGPITLALRHRLTLYDATYLDLAMRLGVPLASFDAALRAAATAEGITPLP
nr:type II toxin-antitoxin system VapC family toxin [Plastoroseomonas arctica]